MKHVRISIYFIILLYISGGKWSVKLMDKKF